MLVVIALVAATFVFLSARRSLRTNLMDVIRRSLIAVVVIIMGAGPSIPGTIIEVTSNIEVYFVIDRTGSMGAEDWDGENPRIDGVRNDVATLMGVLTGARYSILSWDSSVHTDMPLTTDSSAVASYMATFTRELSSSSQGSSINRPAADLAKLLKKNKGTPPRKYSVQFSSSPTAKPRTRITGPALPAAPRMTGMTSSPTSTAASSSATEPRRAAR